MAFAKHLKLEEATLHPPALWRSPKDDDDAAAAGIPWGFLDLEAYVADNRNDTTAYSHTESGKEVQVTFFLEPPPRVSYFCVFCPGRDHTEFPIEPRILAMDENLVLLQIIVSPEKEIYRDCDLFIYQADGASDGGPSLERPPGPYVCNCNNVGLLRCAAAAGAPTASKRRNPSSPHSVTWTNQASLPYYLVSTAPIQDSSCSLFLSTTPSSNRGMSSWFRWTNSNSESIQETTFCISIAR